jgi:hypothetical protein
MVYFYPRRLPQAVFLNASKRLRTNVNSSCYRKDKLLGRRQLGGGAVAAATWQRRGASSSLGAAAWRQARWRQLGGRCGSMAVIGGSSGGGRSATAQRWGRGQQQLGGGTGAVTATWRQWRQHGGSGGSGLGSAVVAAWHGGGCDGSSSTAAAVWQQQWWWQLDSATAVAVAAMTAAWRR